MAPTEQLPALREDHHGVIPYSGSLRDIETTLLCLTEIDPSELTPELLAQYEEELREAVRKAPEKRERVAIKLFDLGQRAAVKRAAAQAYRDKAATLEESAVRFERDVERLKNYVLDVMRELPKPAKGVRTLEGTSATFKAKAVGDSVEIYDEEALPVEFKTATVTMPAVVFRALRETFGGFTKDLAVKWGRVPSAEIKAALQAEVSVPGARLVTGKLRLEVS